MTERRPRAKKKTASRAPRARARAQAGEATDATEATYLFGIVRAARRPALAKVPAGLPDMGPVRLLDAREGLWLLVASAPLSSFDGPRIEARLQDLAWVTSCAVGHQAILDHFATAAHATKGAIVPMKLFTLFTSDERALEHVAAARERLDLALDRVAGCLEWGVRVGFDESRARRALDAVEPAGDGASGASFLLKKKQARDARRELGTRARERVDEVFATLERLVREARRRAPPPGTPGAPVLLDAAYLVPAKSVERFERAVKELQRELEPAGYEIVLTGPWPPYNFVGDAA